ncbi:MAG: 30S ribosomal protein S15 [Candidatus Liptonbacteria bacterium]|nr:30S ribosomal protein S15 [Candidatus Liptonbacteria bacterium]
MLSKQLKARVATPHQRHKSDTGSAEVQSALLSRQIEELAKHLKRHPKDHHSRRGLLKMVSQRRKLLGFLAEHAPATHDKLVKKLGLKK